MSETDSENEYESADDEDSSTSDLKGYPTTSAESAKTQSSMTEVSKEKKENDECISKSFDTISKDDVIKEQKIELTHDSAIKKDDSTLQELTSSTQKQENTSRKDSAIEKDTTNQNDTAIEKDTTVQKDTTTQKDTVIEKNTTIQDEDTIQKRTYSAQQLKSDETIQEQIDSTAKKLDSTILVDDSIIQEHKTESQSDEISVKSEEKNAAKNTFQSTSQQRDKVVDSQPRRVTLRLEKKVQEKQQAASQVSESIANDQSATLTEKVPPSSWGFGSWGSSLLSTAASSVSTFTNQVSQGLGTVLETVENSLGAPAPEDLATLLKERRELNENDDEKEEIISPKEAYLNDQDEEGIPTTSSLFTGVTSLTKAIESTGGKVLMGGLDALEMIGKKTIDILTEGDPGLRNKRATLSGNASLSQLLREAKTKADEDQANTSFENQEEVIHFSSYFDEFQGLIHLEALEMLSSQCQNKVQGALMMTTSGDSAIKDSLDRVKSICEDLPSVDETSDDKTQDFEACLSEHIKCLQLQIDPEKIKNVRNSVHQQIDKCISEQEVGEVKDAKELYRQAISSLAEFSAKCVEQFHKLGELILVQTDTDFDVLTCTTHLTGLTTVLCVEVGIISNKFCQCLNTAADDSEDPDSITPFITTVYIESSNSSTYIQDAFQLLVPVLQAFLLQ